MNRRTENLIAAWIMLAGAVAVAVIGGGLVIAGFLAVMAAVRFAIARR